MLFVIDQSVAALFDNGPVTARDIEGLNNVALGAAEGHHRIIANRNVLQKLASRSELQDKTRNALKRSLNRVAQEGRLHLQLNCYGRVVADTSVNISSAIAGRQRIITFPLQWFDSSARIQPTTLLSENISDVGVLSRIGEVGLLAARPLHPPIKTTPTHGGGSTTASVLTSIASRNQICLCIVDSDRASPMGTMGQTAISVQSFKQVKIYPLIEVTETIGRDLENALPDSFYKDVYGSVKNRKILHFVFAEMTHIGEIEIRSHLDVEKGLNLRMLFKHLVGTPERTFWDAKLPIVMHHAGVDTTVLPCLDSGACSTTPCTCSIVIGNPANILEAFLVWSESIDRFLLARLLDGSVQPEWQRLGLLIASWCIGDDRLRI